MLEPAARSSRIPRRRRMARLGEEEVVAEIAPPAATEVQGELQSVTRADEVAPISPIPVSAAAEIPAVESPVATEPAAQPEPKQDLRILCVHDVASTYRLVEEAFENFTAARVDTTPDILNAFEMAIVRDYQLFVLGLHLPNQLSGSFFYDLIARAYKVGLNEKKIAPAVVFVREADEALPDHDLLQDVRVKAVWSKPLSIERMLDSVSSVIPRLPME